MQALNAKAKARIGLMFSRLPLAQLSLNRLVQLFNIYVLPIYLYGAPLWMSRVARTKLEEMDAVWTRYLKRYLLIPLHSNNAITYHICRSTKLSNLLIEKAKDSRKNLIFPNEFDGLKLSLWNNDLTIYERKLYEDIPTWYWLSKSYYDIPSNMDNRKKLTNQLFDLNHKDFCHTEGFHAKIDSTCFCKFCGHRMEYYHERYCEENISRCRAVSIVLKRIETNSNKPESSGTKNKRSRKKNDKYYGDVWING